MLEKVREQKRELRECLKKHFPTLYPEPEPVAEVMERFRTVMYEKSDQGKSDSCLSVLCDDGNIQIQTDNAASEQPDYSSGLGISNVLSTPILPSIVNTESQYSDETSINVHQSESGSNYAVTSCQPSENVTQINENMYSSSGNSTSYFNPTEEIS